MNASAATDKNVIAAYGELMKPRLTLLVLLTTLVGFYLGWRGPMNYWLLLHTLVGTALVAGGAAALNQWWERDLDAKMRRTAARPLPSGRLQPAAVLIFGGITAAAGLVHLSLAVNLLTGFLGAVSLAIYLFIYTPLKTVTWLNTAVGAVPGALPPLMGWAAARGEVTAGGWALFAIQVFWQLPHFLAIAWMYREEYAKAGFVMLPLVDESGGRTGRQAVSHTLGLLPVSLFPVVLHLAGYTYLLGALILGTTFLVYAIRFSRQLDVVSARRLFYASILYLPVLLILMVVDKLR